MSFDKDIKWLEFCNAGAQIFSSCSKKKYMSIIVDKNGVVNSTGYNGVPTGMRHCDQGGCPRAVNDVPAGTPYDFGDGLCYAIHSEINCLIHSDHSQRIGGTMYVNAVPCFGCAKAIVNSGVARLVYLDEDFDRVGDEFTQRLLKHSKLAVLRVPPTSLSKRS
jgi:dCMP deaminase